MKNRVRREIVSWRLFEGNHPGWSIPAVVLFTTTNGQLRATMGIWMGKDHMMDIANDGVRLTYEEAYPFFKDIAVMKKENYSPA